MTSLKRARELRQIAEVLKSRGVASVIDGDTVAVLSPRRRHSSGLSHVRFQVERVNTLTQAYLCGASRVGSY